MSVLSHHDFQVVLNNILCYILFKKEGTIQINVFVGTCINTHWEDSKNIQILSGTEETTAWMETSITMYIFLYTDF